MNPIAAAIMYNRAHMAATLLTIPDVLDHINDKVGDENEPPLYYAFKKNQVQIVDTIMRSDKFEPRKLYHSKVWSLKLTPNLQKFRNQLKGMIAVPMLAQSRKVPNDALATVLTHMKTISTNTQPSLYI